ncbi:MAG: hypothetical protein ABIT36_13165 [Steroidobacteraceae bacterium]
MSINTIRVLVVAATLSCLGIAGAVKAGDDVVRVSTRFEMAQVQSLLQGISRLCSAGFTRSEALALARQIDALKTEKAQTWEFSATCKGSPRQLKIRALVDELSGVDLDFSTDPDFAAQIRQVVGAQARNKP